MSHAGVSDFRSDTVTRPTPEMYEAMTSADLGDDVFGDDPTVNALQDFAAELFGKDAALYVPSGTMGNQVACRVHARPGEEVLLEGTSHVFLFEQGGLAQLSGLQVRTLPGERGRVPLDAIRGAVRTDNEHFPRTRLIVLENTHNMAGGAVLPLEYVKDVRALADELGLRLHLDGARIANAEAATGVPLADWAACAHSVTCCLSKGLGAPVGTVLMGDRDFIAEARRARKVFGGGMRQAGVIASAGLVALRDMRGRLIDDHRRAARLADGLAALDGWDVVAPETNIVYVDVPGAAAAAAAAFGERGVATIALGPATLRFVTHKDIDDADVDRALEAAAALEY